jgi:hypothetical protein
MRLIPNPALRERQDREVERRVLAWRARKVPESKRREFWMRVLCLIAGLSASGAFVLANLEAKAIVAQGVAALLGVLAIYFGWRLPGQR